MYKYCNKLDIDDRRETIVFSDHNVLTLNLKFKTKGSERKKNQKKLIYIFRMATWDEFF